MASMEPRMFSISSARSLLQCSFLLFLSLKKVICIRVHFHCLCRNARPAMQRVRGAVIKMDGVSVRADGLSARTTRNRGAAMISKRHTAHMIQPVVGGLEISLDPDEASQTEYRNTRHQSVPARLSRLHAQFTGSANFYLIRMLAACLSNTLRRTAAVDGEKTHACNTCFIKSVRPLSQTTG